MIESKGKKKNDAIYATVIRDRRRLKCYLRFKFMYVEKILRFWLQRWFLNSSVEYIDFAKWQLTECGKKGLKNETDDWIVIKICRGRRWKIGRRMEMGINI